MGYVPKGTEMRLTELNALIASIDAWDLYAQGFPKSSDCPLCTEAQVRKNSDEVDCSFCMVFRRTRLRGCVGTPWQLTPDERFKHKSWKLQEFVAVEAEIEFLISLLPSGSEQAQRYQL